MKITEYPEVQTLDDSNVFLLDGSQGTKIINSKKMLTSLMDLLSTSELLDKIDLSQLEELTNDNRVSGSTTVLIGKSGSENVKIKLGNIRFISGDEHSNTSTKRYMYRCKNLGSYVTPEQFASIKDGSFKDLFLGDYWIINGVTWIIADFNYWWNCGDNACTTRHLVIVPDDQLYTANMNDTNITTGGYTGSKMYTANLNQAKTMIDAAFGAEHILNHRELLTNAVKDGQPSGGAWFNSTVELMNEPMVYGSYIHTPANNGSVIPYRYTIDKTQLALMAANPNFINPHRHWYWLRDVVSAANFAAVNGHGDASYGSASDVGGVRPVFGIVG